MANIISANLLPLRHSFIRISPTAQSRGHMDEKPEMYRSNSIVSRSGLVPRRDSIEGGKKADQQEDAVRSMLISAMNQERRFSTLVLSRCSRKPTLTAENIELLQKASTLYNVGDEKQAYLLLQPSVSEAKASVFFTAEKARQQFQVQRRQNMKKICELQEQESQFQNLILHVEAEIKQFERRLERAIAQHEAAKNAMDRQNDELSKIQNVKAKFFASTAAIPSSRTQAFIPFDGLDRLLDTEVKWKENAQWCKEDFQRKQDAILHIENELSDLGTTFRSLCHTRVMIKSSKMSAQRYEDTLEKRKNEVNMFMIESAKNVSMELNRCRGEFGR